VRYEGVALGNCKRKGVLNLHGKGKAGVAYIEFPSGAKRMHIPEKRNRNCPVPPNAPQRKRDFQLEPQNMHLVNWEDTTRHPEGFAQRSKRRQTPNRRGGNSDKSGDWRDATNRMVEAGQSTNRGKGGKLGRVRSPVSIGGGGEDQGQGRGRKNGTLLGRSPKTRKTKSPIQHPCS